MSQPRDTKPTTKVSVGGTVFDCKPEIKHPTTGQTVMLHFPNDCPPAKGK